MLIVQARENTNEPSFSLRLEMDLNTDTHNEGMDFFLTTPQRNDHSYEEKRKYLKRRSHETDEPRIPQIKTISDTVTVEVNENEYTLVNDTMLMNFFTEHSKRKFRYQF